LILAPVGELTVAEAPALRAQLLAAIKDTAERVIVVDLGAVTFLDAAAVGVLIGARERLVKEDRELRIAAPAKQVQRALELLGLDKTVEIYPTVEQAEAEGS
jgi:anti-anti-sigma factor